MKSLKQIAMILTGLLLSMLAASCTSQGSFQPNPKGILEVSINQSIKIPVGGVTYFDSKGVERTNDREFMLPYKWQITGPKE